MRLHLDAVPAEGVVRARDDDAARRLCFDDAKADRGWRRRPRGELHGEAVAREGACDLESEPIRQETGGVAALDLPLLAVALGELAGDRLGARATVVGRDRLAHRRA